MDIKTLKFKGKILRVIEKKNKDHNIDPDIYKKALPDKQVLIKN